RVSQLDDASFLRVAFGGEQHTLGLLDYSPLLREVHAVICSTLAAPLPATSGTAPAETPGTPAPEPDAPQPPPEIDRAY
ncbi:MAG TPA: hypothetical protein VLA16_05860, partial [Ideonella sp.]|nr:hypothetical protein [Ideonella sp.]